jgi:hypothetical protein
MNWLTATLNLLANLTGWGKKKQELNNTPEMTDAAKGQSDQEVRDKATAAVAKDDLDALRRGAAE